MSARNVAFFNRNAVANHIAHSAASEAILRCIREWANIPGEVDTLRELVALKRGTARNDKMYTIGKDGDKVMREFALIPNKLYFGIGRALELQGDPDGRNWIARPEMRDLFFSHFKVGQLVKGTELSKMEG